MPRPLFLLLAPIVALAHGVSADAGVLASATWVERVAGVPITVPVFATGTSTATSVSVSLEIPEFELTIFTPVASVPASLPTPRVRLFVPGGSAEISATPGMAAATMGIPATGTVFSEGKAPFFRLYRVRPSLGAVRTPLTMYPYSQYFERPYFGSVVYVFSSSYGWTPGPATVMGLTQKGVAAPDAKAQGSFALNAFGAGTITLVAPRRIRLDDPLGDRTVGSFTTLTLHFVPEPGAWLLLVAAAAALARSGARAARR